MKKSNVKFFNRISKLYNDGEFRETIKLYEQSLELIGINYIKELDKKYRSALYFKIAESYHKLGNYTGAIRYYKKYLEKKKIYFEDKKDITIEKQLKVLSDKVRVKYIEKMFIKYGYKFIKSPDVMILDENELDFIAVSEDHIYFCSIYKGNPENLNNTQGNNTVWRMENLLKVGRKIIEDFLPEGWDINIENILILMDDEGLENISKNKLKKIKEKVNITTLSPGKSSIVSNFKSCIKKHKQKFLGFGFIDLTEMLMEYIEQTFNKKYNGK